MTGGSRDLSIRRLRVQLGMRSPDEGRAFGSLLAEALGERPLPAGAGGHLETLRIQLVGSAAETPARLASRVADAVIQRATAEAGAR